MKAMKITILFLLYYLTSFAQKEMTSVDLSQNNLPSQKIKIDGLLNEAVWKNNIKNANLIQSSPNNGKPATQKTNIAVSNDESYFYVAAEMYINSKSESQSAPTINKKLSPRDDNGTADYFGVIIDPYGVSREAWAFLVTAANVQLDIKVTNDETYDEWDAVWESAVKVYEDRWTIEIKIPFNSLRFPKGNFDNFTINFERFDSSTNEDSFWNHIDENKDGTLNQFGKLKGLKNVNPPVNLSFNPFVSYVFEKSETDEMKSTFSGGLDLKYVYKNAYTLDVSMIPDFSQAPSDDQILNLSPFDIKYNENRQFFVEGTELFDKGNYLYTRRIGGEPIHFENIEIADNEEIIENPVSSNILNLVKFTGKSNNGLSIGILNGVTNKSEATISNLENNQTKKITTNPLTNYNALVLDQALKNNSSITFINNSVLRSGDIYDANLTAAILNLYNKKRTYSLTARKAISQQYYSKSSNVENKIGHEYYLGLKKVSGKWKAGLIGNLQDDVYDNNDFGFNSRNNKASIVAYTQYAKTNPKKTFSYYHFTLIHLQRYYFSLKEKERSIFQAQFYGNLKNNHSLFLELAHHAKQKDFYEARVEDRVFNKPAFITTFLEYQTNENKNLSFAAYFEMDNYLNSAIYTNAISTGYGLNYRIGNHLSLEFEQDFYYKPNAAAQLTQIDEDIIFGQRKIKEIENGLNIDFAVNSKIHINANIRHYWVQVTYKDKLTLLENGELTSNNYNIDVTKANINYNAFNIDFTAKWQFAPQSELSLVYKLGSNYYDDNITSKYPENFNAVVNKKNNNTIALKLTCLIDFNKAKNLMKKF